MTNKIPESIIKLAQKLSEKSTMKYQLGVVIFNKSRIINTGYNRWLVVGRPTKSHNHTSIHAELDAIVGCSRQELWGSSIFVFRKNFRLAKPCKSCMKVIEAVGIKTVFYTDDNKIKKI